jgi:hypothetical protein
MRFVYYAPPPMLGGSRAAVWIGWLWLLAGCYPPGEGIEPPLSRLYFPVGLAVSPAATRLYAANSNFDLQYNGGTLQVYDLERVRFLAPRGCTADSDCPVGQRCDLQPNQHNGGNPSQWCVDIAGRRAQTPCGALGERSVADRVLEPGRCEYVDPAKPQDGGSPLIVDAVGIGAFATDVVYRSRPPDLGGAERPGGRLFVPVRGDATLHWISVDDDSKQQRTGFELECGQERNDGDCDDRHRVGDDPDAENTRDLRLDPEPFGIDASADGEAIVLTHQTDGAASLFVNDWDIGADPAPRLEYVVAGMPQRVIGVAAVPEPQLVAEADINYQPGFLVTFRDSAEIRLLRYFSDTSSGQTANPARPYLEQSWTVSVSANATGFDSRGIAVDSAQRRACERACPEQPADARQSCLTSCAAIPLRVFVANRSPASLLVGETRPNASETSSDDIPRFTDSIPLPFGPSRVVVGDVIGPDGSAATRVFVVCFDAAMIAIYEPDARRIEQWISTGRGPHAFAVDTNPVADTGSAARPGYAFGYVGHFTDSYIGVVDLDQRNRRTYGEIVLTVGRPTAPRASK